MMITRNDSDCVTASRAVLWALFSTTGCGFCHVLLKALSWPRVGMAGNKPHLIVERYLIRQDYTIVLGRVLPGNAVFVRVVCQQ